jgi:hypothetical protein
VDDSNSSSLTYAKDCFTLENLPFFAQLVFNIAQLHGLLLLDGCLILGFVWCWQALLLEILFVYASFYGTNGMG